MNVNRSASIMPKLPLARFPFASFVALCAATALLATAARAAEEVPDDVKQRVLALARTVSEEDFAFTRTVRTEQISADEKGEAHVMIERFDPRKPADQRWTLVTINGRAPNADELKSYNKETPQRRVANYGRIATIFGAPAVATPQGRGRISYHIAAPAKESLVTAGSDLSSSAVADLIVDTTGAVPMVEETRFTLTKPTRLKLVAKIETLQAITNYRMMPNGKPAPVEQISDTTGSLLGKSGRLKTTIIYSDHQPARG